MFSSKPPEVASQESAPPSSPNSRIPGLVLCIAAAALAYALSLPLPGISPLLLAIVLGVVAANVTGLPRATAPGIDFSAKKLLRAGIVFLGLQLVLTDIAALGPRMLGVIVCIVAAGILGTVLLGRMLGVRPGLALLVACGFSICGAAAVAGAAGVTDPNDEAEEDTVTAVALVVLFGTVMIPLLPSAAHLLGLTSESAGLWAGGSIHEIAQVVAAGGVLGGGALKVGVLVKLARVLLLGPVLAFLGIRQRRLSASGHRSSATTSETDGGESAMPRPQLPPVVPPFILGFLAMVLLRSFVPLPEPVLQLGETLQAGLLAAAMFGLGCGVQVRNLLGVGWRPFVLAGLSTVLVAGVALGGVVLRGA